MPASGIYLFFEKGEKIDIDGMKYDGLVRVGTHRNDGNFPGRIRQHYGNKGNLNGNKNGSVFRLHVGGAIMRKLNPYDPPLAGWLKQMGPSYSDVEEDVSRTLRENFSFVCFPVATKEERLNLESGLISLLAQHPLGKSSPLLAWTISARPIICSTGLWNTRETDKKPLDDHQLGKVASHMGSFSKQRAMENQLWWKNFS